MGVKCLSLGYFVKTAMALSLTLDKKNDNEKYKALAYISALHALRFVQSKAALHNIQFVAKYVGDEFYFGVYLKHVNLYLCDLMSEAFCPEYNFMAALNAQKSEWLYDQILEKNNKYLIGDFVLFGRAGAYFVKTNEIVHSFEADCFDLKQDFLTELNSTERYTFYEK